MFKQYKLKNYRFRLIAYVVILCIIGVMVVGSAKPSVQNKQIVGLIGGLIAMVIISLIDYNTIIKISQTDLFAGCCIACRDIYSGSWRQYRRRNPLDSGDKQF